MTQITVQVEGMKCPMCEAHVNDAIRDRFAVEKVTSSHKKNETIILTEIPIEDESLRATITAMGYQVGSITREPYEKKGFFSRFSK
ncbi:MAG: heavy-metal-associated domain-containing protein [Clostridia bacterium]|nr:heavy-metal-associated domain-containing protein [Clostridia bacterium]